MPRTPSPPGQRRRRNLEQPQWRNLPAEGREGKAPELSGEWLPSTLVWWRTIWASPMAAMWLEADVDPLKRLARLKDLFDRGEAPATALPAMQQLEDRYGLSPKARRALQWEIGKADGDARPKPAPGASSSDARRLRAVDAAS